MNRITYPITSPPPCLLHIESLKVSDVQRGHGVCEVVYENMMTQNFTKMTRVLVANAMPACTTEAQQLKKATTICNTTRSMCLIFGV